MVRCVLRCGQNLRCVCGVVNLKIFWPLLVIITFFLLFFSGNTWYLWAIQGLAIGAFGETGKGISDYFNLLATIATKRVDRAVGGGCRMARRWGLCHSERHTYGAMKGLLQRRFSRVAVRGAAKVRLRALQAITGRIQGRFEVEEGKFYSAEDADRATSTNYLYQEPDCRVERLPDALASTLPGGG